MSKLSFKPIDLEFTGVSFTAQDGGKNKHKLVLNNVSGCFKHGQITAIIGPSGAGKTSLMNILSGFRLKNVTGTITVNGEKRNNSLFNKQCCYIMQESSLLQNITVGEYMQCAASLKIRNNPTDEDKRNVIDSIIKSLGLIGCRNTRVGKLSGGETKRLSIALELVSNPPVLFLDEPTSGLDSSHSFQCVQLLKSLAKEGRTVIFSIHQPSARFVEQFDSIYALADGQCIYKGLPSDIVPVLSSIGMDCPSYHNPVDFLIELAFGETRDCIQQLANICCNQKQSTYLNTDLVDNSVNSIKSVNDTCKTEKNGNIIYMTNEFKEGNFNGKANGFLIEKHTQYLEPVANDWQYPVSFWSQFRVLFWRSLLCTIRLRVLTQYHAAVHILVAVTAGLLFFRIGNDAKYAFSNGGGLFFSVIFITFVSLLPPTLTFPLERSVFTREHLNHWYSLKAYYCARTFADLPFQIVNPILYCIVFYFMTAQPAEADRFLLYVYFMIVTALVHQSIGLVAGCAAKEEMAVFMGLALGIPPALFCGFFSVESAMSVYVRWMANLSHLKYIMHGTFISIYGRNREMLNCSDAFCLFRNPEKYLEQLEISEDYFIRDALLPIVYVVGIRMIGYFILKWKFRTL